MNLVQTTTGRHANRAFVTLIVGVLGSVLSMLGILDSFVGFLIILGVAIPPVAGIMIVDYFVLRRSRAQLDEARRSGRLPASAEGWNVPALVAWAVGFLTGYFVHAGVPSINSLVAAGVAYWLLTTVLGRRQAPLPQAGD